MCLPCRGDTPSYIVRQIHIAHCDTTCYVTIEARNPCKGGEPLEPNLSKQGTIPMTYLPLIPLLVTAAPVLILGIICLISGVEASIRESIGQ